MDNRKRLLEDDLVTTESNNEEAVRVAKRLKIDANISSDDHKMEFNDLVDDASFQVLKCLSTEDREALAYVSKENNRLVRKFEIAQRNKQLHSALPLQCRFPSILGEDTFKNLNELLETLPAKAGTIIIDYLSNTLPNMEQRFEFLKLLCTKGVMENNFLTLWQIFLAKVLVDRGFDSRKPNNNGNYKLTDSNLTCETIKALITHLNTFEINLQKNHEYNGQIEAEAIKTLSLPQWLIKFAYEYLARKIVSELIRVKRHPANEDGLYKLYPHYYKAACNMISAVSIKTSKTDCVRLQRYFRVPSEHLMEIYLVDPTIVAKLCNIIQVLYQMDNTRAIKILESLSKIDREMNTDKTMSAIDSVRHIVLAQRILNDPAFLEKDSAIMTLFTGDKQTPMTSIPFSDVDFLSTSPTSPYIYVNLSNLATLFDKNKWVMEPIFKVIAITHLCHVPYTEKELNIHMAAYYESIEKLKMNDELYKKIIDKLRAQKQIDKRLFLILAYHLDLFIRFFLNTDLNIIQLLIDINHTSPSEDSLKQIISLAKSNISTDELCEILSTKERKNWIVENTRLFASFNHSSKAAITQHLLRNNKTTDKIELIKCYINKLLSIRPSKVIEELNYFALSLFLPYDALKTIKEYTDTVYEKIREIPLPSEGYISLPPIQNIFVTCMLESSFYKKYLAHIQSQVSGNIFYKSNAIKHLVMLTSFLDELDSNAHRILMNKLISVNLSRTERLSLLEIIFNLYERFFYAIINNEKIEALFNFIKLLTTIQDNDIITSAVNNVFSCLNSNPKISTTAFLLFFNDQTKNIIKEQNKLMEESAKQLASHSLFATMDTQENTPDLMDVVQEQKPGI